MQLPLAVAEAGQYAGLFLRLRQLHAPLAEPQGLQLPIRYLHLPVDNTVANAVNHVATFNSHICSYVILGSRMPARSAGNQVSLAVSGGDGRLTARTAGSRYRPARLCSLS